MLQASEPLKELHSSILPSLNDELIILKASLRGPSFGWASKLRTFVVAQRKQLPGQVCTIDHRLAIFTVWAHASLGFQAAHVCGGPAKAWAFMFLHGPTLGWASKLRTFVVAQRKQLPGQVGIFFHIFYVC